MPYLACCILILTLFDCINCRHSLPCYVARTLLGEICVQGRRRQRRELQTCLWRGPFSEGQINAGRRAFDFGLLSQQNPGTTQVDSL